MSKTIDITGPIYTGMWSYPPPYPKFRLRPMYRPKWVQYSIYADYFEGMCSQTGTYLETPAHFYGYEDSYPLVEVSVEKLMNIISYVVKLDLDNLPIIDDRRAITKEVIEGKFSEDEYKSKNCKAIIVSTGWGIYWKSENYLTNCPFMKYEAMDFLISMKPFLIVSDSPRWENLKSPEGFFPKFYQANILMLAPCINLEKISSKIVYLTVLPLKVEKTCAAPCRAVVIEDG